MLRRARELGLKKSKQFMNRTSREALEKAKEVNEITEYKAQRNKAMELHHEWREQHPDEHYPGTFKKGIPSVQRFGKRKEKLRLQRSLETRNQTLERDRRRMRMGLQPLTRVFKENASTRDKILLRSYMKRKYGYRPLFRNPNVMYYNQSTRRSEHLEREARLYGIQIQEYNEKD